jgi:hypothetical protein
MKRYMLLAAMSLYTGTVVCMTKAHAKDYMPHLKKRKKKDEYELTNRCEFKPGAEMEVDFTISKQFALDLDDDVRRKSMIKAAAETLDTDKKSHFTNEGKPEVAALEALLGFNISAKERDEAAGDEGFLARLFSRGK